MYDIYKIMNQIDDDASLKPTTGKRSISEGRGRVITEKKGKKLLFYINPERDEIEKIKSDLVNTFGGEIIETPGVDKLPIFVVDMKTGLENKIDRYLRKKYPNGDNIYTGSDTCDNVEEYLKSRK